MYIVLISALCVHYKLISHRLLRYKYRLFSLLTFIITTSDQRSATRLTSTLKPISNLTISIRYFTIPTTNATTIMSSSEHKSITIGYGKGKGKGKGATPKASTSSSKDTSNMPAHVRALSAFIARGRKARGLLAQGPVVDIHLHDSSEVVASPPLALFTALSSTPDIVQHTSGTPYVTLPAYILAVSVKDLITRLTPFSDPATTIAPMSSTGDVFKDLHIASAAEVLGLTLYTQPMFNSYFARFKSSTPSPADLTAISRVATPLGNNLFASVIYDLATLYWHRNLPDHAAFDAFCEHNTRVRDAVDALCAKWQAADKSAALHEERRVARAKQQAKVAAKVAEQQRKFAAKAAEDKALGQVVREKMRVKGSKYTGAEARYVWATFGKRVPVQSGN
jgi:hypothetical protein